MKEHFLGFWRVTQALFTQKAASKKNIPLIFWPYLFQLQGVKYNMICKSILKCPQRIKKEEKNVSESQKRKKRETHQRISKKKEIKRKTTNHCYIKTFLAYLFFQGVPEKLRPWFWPSDFFMFWSRIIWHKLWHCECEEELYHGK